MRPLEGKVAIVTGSSRGIGKAIAERLGRDGARVVVTYVGNEKLAAEVVERIRVSGSEALAVRVDLMKLEDIRSLFDHAVERFGKVDILINNAPGKTTFKPTAAMTPEEYDGMFLATRGVYFTLREAANRLADGGRIVSISTGGTVMAMAAAGAYAGSKAAIEQFSMALAKELGARGITVNAVRPGVTDTEGLTLDKAQVGHLVSQTPLGRLGKPVDIADAVALLVTDDARWITAQNISVTGGIV